MKVFFLSLFTVAILLFTSVILLNTGWEEWRYENADLNTNIYSEGMPNPVNYGEHYIDEALVVVRSRAHNAMLKQGDPPYSLSVTIWGIEEHHKSVVINSIEVESDFDKSYKFSPIEFNEDHSEKLEKAFPVDLLLKPHPGSGNEKYTMGFLSSNDDLNFDPTSGENLTVHVDMIIFRGNETIRKTISQKLKPVRYGALVDIIPSV